ncbi:MAG: SprT family zinc-dependent metalloprotease [Acidobacteriota bacterium]|jgi:predicted metal-dependent hydrolase
MQGSGILTALVVNGRRVPVAVVSSVRRRTVCVQVYPDGSVVVRIPAGLPLSSARRFFETKRQWAAAKVEAAHRTAASRPSRTFRDGEKILFLGRERSIKIGPDPGRRAGCELVGDDLLLNVVRQEEGVRKAEADRLVAQWFLSRAGVVFPTRIERLAPAAGASPARVSYRRNRSRWGSCNAEAKHLTFNWQLLMAPLDIVDYVVLHELCHLRVSNHSSAFWALVERSMPDFRERRGHLKSLGWRYVL